MRSRHVDTFNHDPWAADYDADVRNEADPIRAGYEDLLTWIAGKVPDVPGLHIVDLGSGTGNLTSRLPLRARITAVDTSSEMINLAKSKQGEHHVDYVLEDVLAWLTENEEPVDVFVSTYALHHLTDDEKAVALKAMAKRLNTGGLMAIGDLMFRSVADRKTILDGFQEAGKPELVSDISDEFFWNLETDLKILDHEEFRTETRQFSDLSWGFVAMKSPET